MYHVGKKKRLSVTHTVYFTLRIYMFMFLPENTVFGSITYQYIYVNDFVLLVLGYVVKY